MFIPHYWIVCRVIPQGLPVAIPIDRPVSDNSLQNNNFSNDLEDDEFCMEIPKVEINPLIAANRVNYVSHDCIGALPSLIAAENYPVLLTRVIYLLIVLYFFRT